MYTHKFRYTYMKKNVNKIPTTVKLDKGLYDDLKILSVRHKFTLQAFVEKCIYLYIHDDEMKNVINSFNMPILNSSGSL
jgi:hypothetical protein